MILRLKSQQTAGNVLLVGLCITAILGFTLTSYLALVDHQCKSVARSQIWNSAMVVAEAGVEDALQFINKFAASPDPWNWASNGYSSDNWTRNGNLFSVTRYLDEDHTTYYRVYITNSSVFSPTIRSTGYVPGPSWLRTSIISPMGANSVGANTISRTVVVRTKIDSMFNVAMAALGNIDLKGNGIKTDSFDSGATNYPGYWTNTIRRANGDVITNNQITNSVLSVENANIAGHIKTGPVGSVDIGPNGSVGDLAWVDAPTAGIKPGWYDNDLNVIFPDAVLPNTLWLPAPGSGVVDGTSYDHVFLISGDYSINDSGNIYVGTNVTVRLNVKTTKYAPVKILVAGTGNRAGRLWAYMNGPPPQSCTLGSDNKSESGLATSLAFFGLPNCTSLFYNGNGDFTGVMYFPQADFQLAGGGSEVIDFIGSSVTRTVQMNGHYNFHYDENLKNLGPSSGFKATSWCEVP